MNISRHPSRDAFPTWTPDGNIAYTALIGARDSAGFDPQAVGLDGCHLGRSSHQPDVDAGLVQAGPDQAPDSPGPEDDDLHLATLSGAARPVACHENDWAKAASIGIAFEGSG